MLQAQVQYLVRELRSHMLHGQKILIFLPAILIPVCASSSLAFLMMYSAYKLNKQGDNIQLVVKKKVGQGTEKWDVEKAKIN